MPTLTALKHNMTKDLFGMSKQEGLSSGLCIDCKEEALPKCYSEAGKKEFKISGLCEQCFDKIMGG